MRRFYGVLYAIVWLALQIWHPFSKVVGRENIPEDGFVICTNHSSMADPFWIALGMGVRRRSRYMAKKEILRWPIVGRICKTLGAFGIERGGADLMAVKATMTYLRNGENVLIFPEGTRMKPGKTVRPKSGAVLLALRTGVPILPAYITARKRPFRPVRVVFGTPFVPKSESRRPTATEMSQMTAELMDDIYTLGERT